jgi:hypothetical protein
MICPAPTLRTPSYATWDHTIIKSVCAGHDFPIHDDEGVSLWFSGQRLLTDGTSENSVKRKFNFVEFIFHALTAVNKARSSGAGAPHGSLGHVLKAR